MLSSSSSENVVPSAARFQTALASHQQGQLLQAKAGYEAVLQDDPEHFDARHLLGVVYLGLQQLEDARQQIAQALALRPDNSDACYNMGLVMDGLGAKQEAISWYDKSIQANPANSKAYNNKSKSCLDLGLLDDALSSCDAAIRIKPDYAEAFNNRGNVLLRRGDPGGALSSFDQALRLRSAYAEAHANRGHTLRAMKQWDAALASYDQAIALRANDALAYDGRGLVLMALGLPQAALISHERAATLDPKDAAYAQHCADTLVALDRWTQAVAWYDRALALRPHWAEVMVSRGNALMSDKQFHAALLSYRQAIVLHPEWAEVHNNEGNALKGLGQFEEAMASYQAALAISPTFAEAHGNLGNALLGIGRFNEAMAQYERVIAMRPELAESWWNKSLLLLLQGVFEPGWELYEWRWKSRVQSAQFRNFSQPLWLGENDINGKTILLHAEQGLGDTLQFCRYAKHVAALGARVILEVQPPLLALLDGLTGVDQVVERGKTLPAFDFQTPLLSLPLAFKTRLETIPADPAYLQSSPDKVRQWEVRLGARQRPRVGLVWRGNPHHGNDQNRSLALSVLLPHLPEGIDYVCLQKDLRDDDRDALQQDGRVRFVGSELGDFSDTAALCDLMDVVISVDTSVAHLSAALGRPTWILLPHVPDWRWLLDRADSPWYPSAQLFRQDPSRTWDQVLPRLEKNLRTSLLAAHP